jgi:hypothetical protein
MPIRMYSKVQTGPNTQLGGLKEGLFKVLYQESTDSAVNKPPIAPTDNGIARQMINGIT